jgi:hypothetical protein
MLLPWNANVRNRLLLLSTARGAPGGVAPGNNKSSCSVRPYHLNKRRTSKGLENRWYFRQLPIIPVGIVRGRGRQRRALVRGAGRSMTEQGCGTFKRIRLMTAARNFDATVQLRLKVRAFGIALQAVATTPAVGCRCVSCTAGASALRLRRAARICLRVWIAGCTVQVPVYAPCCRVARNFTCSFAQL